MGWYKNSFSWIYFSISIIFIYKVNIWRFWSREGHWPNFLGWTAKVGSLVRIPVGPEHNNKSANFFVLGLDLWGEKKGGKIQMYVFDFNYHRRVKKTLYRSPLHNKYMFVYNIERYFMYSIYKKEPKWHKKHQNGTQKTENMSGSVIIFFMIFLRREFYWFSSTII